MDCRANFEAGQLQCFDEDEWLRIFFLIADTKKWLDEISRKIVLQVPISNHRQLYRKTYYIEICSLAHILERHYYKIQRYPNTGKFSIPIADILAYLRDSFVISPVAIAGTLNFKRVIQTDKIIGFDLHGQSTNIITIITNPAGMILTAFPGQLKK